MIDDTLREVRAELLSPTELDAAIARAAIAYLPLGSIEFHGAHLPVGLDSLTAHGVCVAAARAGGGVVLPTVYQGLGGEHSAYAWTIMVASDAEVRSLIAQTLARLEAFGVRVAVLLTGHFAGEQQNMVDNIAAAWNADSAHTLRAVGTAMNRCPTSPIAPDHAGVFETTLLYALHPELVHLDRLPALDTHPPIDAGGDVWGAQRHDPTHPLFGVFGPDPREFDPAAAPALLSTTADWLAELARVS